MPQPNRPQKVDDQMFEAIGNHGSGALAQLRVALAGGADPNATRRGDGEHRAWSALEWVARRVEPGAAALAAELIQAGAAPVFEGQGRASALVIAARFGAAETVHALLELGHSPKAANQGGWTPFLCAAASGRFELCEALAARSDAKASAADGSKGLRVDAASLFVANEQPGSALKAYSLGWGSPGIVGNSRWTPLIRAILGGARKISESKGRANDSKAWDELVDYLASHPDCDREHADFHGQTAMHYAVESRRPDHVRMLAKNGHAIDRLSAHGLTPLADALLIDAVDCAAALLDLGADPSLRQRRARKGHDDRDRGGIDALCAALRSTNEEVEALASTFAHRCSRSATMLDGGHGALHLAAGHEDPSIAQRWTARLLSLGWSPRKGAHDGQTPLLWAMQAENYAAMDLLLPVSDLARKTASGLDAMGAAEWLATNRGKPGPLEMLLAHVERAALSKLARVKSRKTKPPTRSL